MRQGRATQKIAAEYIFLNGCSFEHNVFERDFVSLCCLQYNKYWRMSWTVLFVWALSKHHKLVMSSILAGRWTVCLHDYLHVIMRLFCFIPT